MDFLNSARFHLRNRFYFSPKARLRTMGFDAFQRGLSPAAKQRAESLARRYPFEHLEKTCDEVRWQESLYVVDVLHQQFSSRTLPSGRHLDVGSKNGSYLPGLAAFCPHWDAIELDAHQRYWNFTTRRAFAEAIAKRLNDVQFFAGSVLSLRGRYALITWFLPFVVEAPHRAWGLPRRFFLPEETLAHVWSLLQPQGFLWVVNQGELEAEQQKQLFQSMGIHAHAVGEVQSLFSPFKKKRFGFWVQKS